jgi:hypothetical protein
VSAEDVWPKIREALDSGDTELARRLLWPPDVTQDWCSTMATRMEFAGGGFEKSNRPLAIFCYEQARNLYESESSGATSGGEGMANMSDMRGRELGHKIWLLKS